MKWIEMCWNGIINSFISLIWQDISLSFFFCCQISNVSLLQRIWWLAVLIWVPIFVTNPYYCLNVRIISKNAALHPHSSIISRGTPVQAWPDYWAKWVWYEPFLFYPERTFLKMNPPLLLVQLRNSQRILCVPVILLFH